MFQVSSRVKRNRIVKPGEMERAVELAARRAGPEGSILILLDADRDCPGELAPKLLRRAVGARSDRPISVVLAKSEFESWFIAAAESIAGRQGIRKTAQAPATPESINDAKAWLSGCMPSGRSYRSTRDQPGLATIFRSGGRSSRTVVRQVLARCRPAPEMATGLSALDQLYSTSAPKPPGTPRRPRSTRARSCSRTGGRATSSCRSRGGSRRWWGGTASPARRRPAGPARSRW